ncbi:MAG: toll/interleukin-1 receptor domain-containing protein, partial [Longimicrobiales bacterium]
MIQLVAIVVLTLVLAGLVVWVRRRRPAVAAVPHAPPRDDVRITVYRPASVAAGRWYELLVYAHRAEGPTEEGGWQTDLSARVEQAAAAELGDLAPRYRTATEDAAIPVVRDTQLEFVPQIDGFQFNPPRIVLNWVEELHEAEFRMCAGAHLDGTTARGQLTVFNGPLILAQMALVIRVAAEAATEPAVAEESVRLTVATYRRVFASYSHQDAGVVRRLREYGQALGDRYLLDVTDIRSGERWEPRIEELIAQADVFQLFWSWNSIRSEYVQREWRHALSLGRANFVRPVYWEDPLPAMPEDNLPPTELSALHFQRVRLAEPVPPAQPSRRRPTVTAPRLATAAMLLVAAGAVGVAVQQDESAMPVDVAPMPGRGGGTAPRPDPTTPVVRPDPPPTAPMPPPAPAPVPAIVIAAFNVPSAEIALTRLADELRRAFVANWN